MEPYNAVWQFNAKWDEDIAELGYTMIPNALLQYYTDFELTPSEFLVIVNIESYRWDARKLPFPTVETLAKRTGMTPRSITRIITSLHKRKHLIRRIKRKGTSNAYSLEPLVSQLGSVIWDGKRNS